MITSLVKKLGDKGLLAFSVHPGLVLGSGLANHLDMSDPNAGDFAGLSRRYPTPCFRSMLIFFSPSLEGRG